MFWKVNYEKDNKRDCLFYGELITEEEKKERIKKLKDNGYKILSCYKVKRCN